MSKTPQSTAQTRFLLSSLMLIAVIIMTLVVILAAYPSLLAPPPTRTPTITLTRTVTLTPSSTPTITLSPTLTRTPRPTFTPSITLTPSKTPTPSETPTPTGPSTFTPAAPVIGESNYKLYEWTPELADSLVEYLTYYPDSLPATARGKNNENYIAAFYYAIVAQREALQRFPVSEQAKRWRWDLANSLARKQDPLAAQYYAEVLAEGLNTGETPLDRLPVWFQEQEYRLALFLTQIKPPSGYLSGRLAEVEGQGSAFVLLLEKTGGFEGYPLTSDFNYSSKQVLVATGTPQPTSEPESDFEALTGDLTGDGLEEIVIYQTNPREIRQLSLPRVFDLANLPPRELIFNQANSTFDIGMEYANQWSVARGTSGQNELVFKAELFPACPVEIERRYRWNGYVFEPVGATYQLRPYPSTLHYCQFIVEHATNLWGPEATIPLMETLLPDWPPSRTTEGVLFPLDARDELRFRLGVYNALSGHLQEATRYMNEIIDSPSIPNSRFIGPATTFTNIYKKPEDIYRACLGTEYCRAPLAVKYLIDHFGTQDQKNIIAYLWDSGLILRASGYFDFDGDGNKDTWFSVRHSAGEKLEFWMLLPYGDQIAGISLGALDRSAPELAYFNEEEEPPVVVIDGHQAFLIKRVPGNRQPYLTPFDLPQGFPNRFREALEKASEALLSGGDPVEIRKELKDLQDYPGLLCRANWSCDSYYYMLGLASELAGDERGAVTAYLRLWWDYSKSPYTIMARFKLKPLLLPSPTPTQTRTPTVTLTSTGTQAASPTSAGTPVTPTRTPPGFITPTRTRTVQATTPVGPYPGPEATTPVGPYPESQ